MSKTQTDLVVRVLQEIGVLAAGQNPAAEDVVLVTNSLQPVADELAADEIVYVPDLDDIDDAIFMSLAVCVASRLAGDFGATFDPMRNAEAEARLRRIGRNGPKYTNQVVEFV